MKHPAKYSPEILAEFRHQLAGMSGVVLDPFAGAGGVHALNDFETGLITYGVELEPEWAAMNLQTQVGDATNLMWPTASVDIVVTSPCYGNRMADKDMRDSVASTYMKQLGREASPGSACHMQWGTDYRALHGAAWKEVMRVLRPGGLMLLNISDHVRHEQRQKVVGWHVQYLQMLGFTITDIVPVKTKRMKHGANAESRVDAELVIRLEKA